MQRNYLDDLELGRRNPSVRTLVKGCARLLVSRCRISSGPIRQRAGAAGGLSLI